MATQAIPGYGTLLKIGDGGSPETFATVVEVTEIAPPEITLNTEDATSHDSNGWTEVIGTLLDGGEISGKINWRPTNATQDETTGLLYAIMNRVKKNWKVVLPGTVKTFTFAALLTKFKGVAPVDGKLEAEFTLKISGPVTIS
jgi:Lambda phage tail tube protein, TTP